MVLQSYKIMRCLVLGLMFFLAATAPCSSNSYDPDPYDDVPPVVSVEFNYVVPSRITVRQPSAQFKMRHSASLQPVVRLAAAAASPLFQDPVALVSGQNSPESVKPLRL
jgi:hypothetical protein